MCPLFRGNPTTCLPGGHDHPAHLGPAAISTDEVPSAEWGQDAASTETRRTNLRHQANGLYQRLQWQRTLAMEGDGKQAPTDPARLAAKAQLDRRHAAGGDPRNLARHRGLAR